MRKGRKSICSAKVMPAAASGSFSKVLAFAASSRSITKAWLPPRRPANVATNFVLRSASSFR